MLKQLSVDLGHTQVNVMGPEGRRSQARLVNLGTDLGTCAPQL